MFALFKYAETLSVSSAYNPVVSLDYDFGRILSKTLEADLNLKNTFSLAFTELGIDLQDVLDLEKDKCKLNKSSESFFGRESDQQYPRPSGFGLIYQSPQSTLTSVGNWSWINDEFLSTFDCQ